MKAVYIETTIISYLAARKSNEVVQRARQEITWKWWTEERSAYRLVTSSVVVQEASEGDSNASATRLQQLSGLELISVNAEAERLAEALVAKQALPPTAAADALHVGVVAVHGVEYLLTWNFRHLANASTQAVIRQTVLEHGFVPPEICTPEELFHG